MKKLLLLFCLLLSSCTNMKPQECIDANWQEIGYKDAIQGHSISLKSRTQTCAKVKLTPNKKAYLLGHTKGSQKFCTFKNGFRYGIRGNDSTKVCQTPLLAKTFYEGYREGLQVYREELYLRERRYELRRHMHRLRHHQKHKHKK